MDDEDKNATTFFVFVLSSLICTPLLNLKD